MFDEKNHLGSYTDKEISLLKKLSSSVDDDHKWKVIGELTFKFLQHFILIDIQLHCSEIFWYLLRKVDCIDL